MALEKLGEAAVLKKEPSDFRNYFGRRANNRDFYRKGREIRINFLLSEPLMAASFVRARKIMADIRT